MVKVVIGIQARTASTRLPNKALELIDNKASLQHVLDSVHRSVAYINNHSIRTGYAADVVLLIPKGDDLKEKFKDQVEIIEGDPTDVLSRYLNLKADYVCRIGGDCPLIPHYLISKCIQIAVKNNYSYVSNVGELRTSPVGHDVEVINSKCLEWLGLVSKGEEREHVTLRLHRGDRPRWLTVGIIQGHKDESDLKLSLDTPEDLEVIRKEYLKIKTKFEKAQRTHGRTNVHRY